MLFKHILIRAFANLRIKIKFVSLRRLGCYGLSYTKSSFTLALFLIWRTNLLQFIIGWNKWLFIWLGSEGILDATSDAWIIDGVIKWFLLVSDCFWESLTHWVNFWEDNNFFSIFGFWRFRTTKSCSICKIQIFIIGIPSKFSLNSYFLGWLITRYLKGCVLI